MNYKEESELLRGADMAHDVLQQSHNINALNTHNPAPPSMEEGFTQVIAAIRELRDYSGQKQRSRSKSRNKRNPSPARSPSGSRNNKKGLCRYHHKFGTEARNCRLPCNWKRGPGEEYRVLNPDTSSKPEN